MISNSRASVPINEDPKLHYGHSSRSGYTPCGKSIDNVTVTWYRDCVTCPDCRDELGLSVTRPYQEKYRDASSHDWTRDHDSLCAWCRRPDGECPSSPAARQQQPMVIAPYPTNPKGGADHA